MGTVPDWLRTRRPAVSTPTSVKLLANCCPFESSPLHRRLFPWSSCSRALCSSSVCKMSLTAPCVGATGGRKAGHQLLKVHRTVRQQYHTPPRKLWTDRGRCCWLSLPRKFGGHLHKAGDMHQHSPSMKLLQDMSQGPVSSNAGAF